jgi:hypothetical protein
MRQSPDLNLNSQDHGQCVAETNMMMTILDGLDFCLLSACGFCGITLRSSAVLYLYQSMDE